MMFGCDGHGGGRPVQRVIIVYELRVLVRARARARKK